MRSTANWRATAAVFLMAFSAITALGPAAAANPVADSGIAPMETTAPKCMLDKEKKGKIYTTVWVTNSCKRNYRVQLIMARGADSRCFSITPGQTRSHTSRGISPYLDRIILC
ncbi:hypothetical protein [Saccharopolyspora sp. ASAGF58]|uniref:hypothetical protein n=1 Tax=Saccharopolyspora sp. ASAGF58 TaxID=2719023 RepID=UPI00143FC0CD|nr:hypothetical protein [Saccharopolyspora sp. ASAGF58]QIZ39116.1 hypothetical protein FDZ84_37295 [Saccharopolyspora sp. ASAGF58]